MVRRRTRKTASKRSLPEPSLEHLKRLTDDTGLFQHAKFTIPLRQEGYTTDDNVRALIVTTQYYALYRDMEALRLLDRYLAFVLHSHNDDGTVRNFMNFDRTWHKAEPVHDALGRVIWAFGAVLAQPPSQIYVPIVRERIDISAPLIEKQYPRGMAYSILGLSGYLKRVPDADDIREYMKKAADAIVMRYEEENQPDWPWFEDVLTYDNAMLPCALFTAATTLNEKKYLKVAQKTCEFLLANTFTGDHFSFVGCQGWFPRGGQKAQFDQQPIEAAGTILMLKAAYETTKDKKFLSLQRKAFNWFLGENDLGIPLYDSETKGCGDGLGTGGVNLNQGAESTVSFLLSRLLMEE
ncbi:MAG: hypothetical protein MUO27_01130 [Sedimentisphaerales bacterium]|nr:hypothetical protein [Sedimentisphaerales bacterium]